MPIHDIVACAAYHVRDIDWGSVPDWIVAIAASATAGFGSYQLYLLRIARTDAVQAQNRATDQHVQNVKTEQGVQLMQIDNQYEGVLHPSRKALLTLRRNLEKKVGHNSLHHREELAKLVSQHLNDLRLKAMTPTLPFAKKLNRRYVDEYFLLTQLPNYIETMGVLVEEGLVDEGALIRLYDGMIERVIGDVLPHIKWRRSKDENPKYLMYAEKLYEKAAKNLLISAAS